MHPRLSLPLLGGRLEGEMPMEGSKGRDETDKFIPNRDRSWFRVEQPAGFGHEATPDTELPAPEAEGSAFGVRG